MASRYARYSPVPTYQPFHISAAGTLVPVGLCVGTTGAQAITAGQSVSITPASRLNILPGMILNLSNGSGIAENVTVLSITPTTFNANVQNSYSSGFTIVSRRGVDLGNIVVNNAGSNCTLTLYNGHPSLAPDAGVPFAIIPIEAGMPLDYGCTCDKGLFYTLAGSGCDLTLMYLDQVV